MPFASEVHVNTSLSTWAAAYKNGDMVADIVCPIVFSTSRSDVYLSFNRADSATIRTDILGPDAEANRSTFSVSSTAFSVVDRGLKDVVGNDAIANADAPLQPMMDATENLMQRILLSRESRVATLLTTAGNYSSTGAVTAAWTDETSGVPLDDFKTAITTIPPGQAGNTKLIAVMSESAWLALRKHPQMIGGGANTPVLSKAEAATRVGVDEIVVSTAEQNTADEGQTASFSRLWTVGSVAVIRIPSGAPRPRQSSFCLTFRFTGNDGSRNGISVRQWSEPKYGPRGSQAIQISLSDDEVVVQSDMGYLLTGAHA